jgi:hypothetical protein
MFCPSFGAKAGRARGARRYSRHMDFLDELRQLADAERLAVERRDAAMEEANERHAAAMVAAYDEYTQTSPERARQMGALMLRAVDEGVRAADVAQALGIPTRRAQTQLRHFRKMDPESRAQYGAPPSPEQLRSRLHAVSDYSPLEET